MAKPGTGSIPRSPNFLPDEIVVNGYLLALQATGGSPKTIATYQESIKILQQFCVERRMPLLVALTGEHLRESLTALCEKGNKASTVNIRFKVIQRLYRWLVAEGKRDEDPMARLPAPRVPETLQPTTRKRNSTSFSGMRSNWLRELPAESRRPSVPLDPVTQGGRTRR
jgi:site-specific recombinase XerD